MGRVRAAHPDVLSGAFLLVVAIVYGAIALRIPSGDGEPGPGALPIALAVVLGGLSVWTLAQGLRSVSASATADRANGAAPGPAVRTSGVRPWLAVLATLVYVMLFQSLGFIVTTPAYAAALAWLFGRDRRILVAVSMGVTVGLFVFFRLILGVRLPMGPFG